MEDPLIMIRLKEPDYETEEARNSFISIMKKYKSPIDSVALFVGNFHNFLPYDIMEKRLEIIENSIKEIKSKLKTLTGINLLSTIGHLDETNMDIWKLKEIPHMVSYDGKICEYIPCPSSKEFLEDTRLRYNALAKLVPDFIWIDDDLRMQGHRPVSMGCFCDTCLKNFSKTVGKIYKREELVFLLKQDTKEGEEIKRKYLCWCDKVLFNLIKLIEETVHRENPNIILGLMMCWGLRYNFPQYLEILRKRTSKVFVRPGGGFYSDDVPFGLIEKAITYSLQIPILGVKKNDVVLAEIEHFPYNVPLKSKKIYSTEITASIASGCNGATINISGMIPNVFFECETFIKGTKKLRNFWEVLSQEIKDIPVSGAYLPYTSSISFLKSNIGIKDEKQFPKGPINFSNIGIPITGNINEGVFSLLTKREIDGMNKSELEKILSKPAIIDATAVDYINKKGLSNLIGVKIEKEVNYHCIEEYTNFGNIGLEGKYRDSRPKFYNISSFTFKIMSNEVKILSKLKTDYNNGDFLGYSSTIFENRFGAKIICFGYDPWNFIFTSSKIKQIHFLIKYITKNTFPFLILFPPRVCAFLRFKKNNKMVITCLNASFDDVNEIKFYTPYKFSNIEKLNLKGDWELLRFKKGENEIILKCEIPCWETSVFRIF